MGSALLEVGPAFASAFIVQQLFRCVLFAMLGCMNHASQGQGLQHSDGRTHTHTHTHTHTVLLGFPSHINKQRFLKVSGPWWPPWGVQERMEIDLPATPWPGGPILKPVGAAAALEGDLARSGPTIEGPRTPPRESIFRFRGRCFHIIEARM